jgi:hypothetical protein
VIIFRSEIARKNKVLNYSVIVGLVLLNIVCQACLIMGGVLPNNLATGNPEDGLVFRVVAIGINDVFAVFGIFFLMLMSRSIDQIQSKIVEQTITLKAQNNENFSSSNFEQVLNTQKILKIKLAILVLMFSILLNGGVFALSYVTKNTLIDVIAFYSRIIVMIVFGFLVGCVCWFFIDMSRISVSVEINNWGHMVIVEHNQHKKVER